METPVSPCIRAENILTRWARGKANFSISAVPMSLRNEHFRKYTVRQNPSGQGLTEITIKKDGNVFITIDRRQTFNNVTFSQRFLTGNEYAGWLRIECGFQSFQDLLDQLNNHINDL